MKNFLIGFLEGMFLGFGGNAIILALPHILKQKGTQVPQTVINYNLEDRRTIQIIQTVSTEPREVNHCIIATSTKSVGESDFS